MPEMLDYTKPNEMIRADSLTCGRFCDLKDVSFSVACGGIHGVLGAKGAKKTRLLDVLAGCEEVDAGCVEISGEKMTLENKALRKKIGYVPARPSFYSDMTAFELLNFIGGTRGVSADKRYRQIEESIDLLGLDEVQNRLIGSLSSEQKKRLSFAASLLGNTELVLLDEPLFGVPEEAHGEIIALIRLLGKHKTVLVASRSYSLIKELCEDVILLSDGMVLAQDTLPHLDESTRATKNLSFEEFYCSTLENTEPSSLEQASEETVKDEKEGQE